jgi:hypothetical protein
VGHAGGATLGRVPGGEEPKAAPTWRAIQGGGCGGVAMGRKIPGSTVGGEAVAIGGAEASIWWRFGAVRTRGGDVSHRMATVEGAMREAAEAVARGRDGGGMRRGRRCRGRAVVARRGGVRRGGRREERGAARSRAGGGGGARGETGRSTSGGGGGARGVDGEG